MQIPAAQPTYPLSTLIVQTTVMVAALITLLKAVIEYRLQNRLKRFEKYKVMMDEFINNTGFQGLREALKKGGDDLAHHDPNDKYMFMTFYQEIAMMVQSGLMRMDVAAYMVGFDAREVSMKRDAFICNLWGGTRDPNFALFWDFLQKLDDYVAPYYPTAPRLSYVCKVEHEEETKDVVGSKPWPVGDFKF